MLLFMNVPFYNLIIITFVYRVYVHEYTPILYINFEFRFINKCTHICSYITLFYQYDDQYDE